MIANASLSTSKDPGAGVGSEVSHQEAQQTTQQGPSPEQPTTSSPWPKEWEICQQEPKISFTTSKTGEEWCRYAHARQAGRRFQDTEDSLMYHHKIPLARKGLFPYLALFEKEFWPCAKDIQEYMVSKAAPGHAGETNPVISGGQVIGWAELIFDDTTKEEVEVCEALKSFQLDIWVQSHS